MKQGDLGLLSDPVAEELLNSTALARLAYTWCDDSPRVVPIWFHWAGHELVMCSPVRAPKLRVLPARPRVAVTIDKDTAPWRVLLLRGETHIEMVDGIVPEYAHAARRYLGEDAGNAWLEQLAATPAPGMARIAVVPDWVGILDFETRFPSALEL